MIPEHVDDLKTIREFRNVFEVVVQKLKADQFRLGMMSTFASKRVLKEYNLS